MSRKKKIYRDLETFTPEQLERLRIELRAERDRLAHGDDAFRRQFTRTVDDYELLLLQVLAIDQVSRRADARRSKRMSRHRSVLAFVDWLLPPDVREEVLDEWMDDVETASEEGKRIGRRVFWILVRSLPSEVWRSRRPARVRGGGG